MLTEDGAPQDQIHAGARDREPGLQTGDDLPEVWVPGGGLHLDFDLFGGQKKTILVTLNAAGKKVIAQSGGKPIPAVTSAANKNRVVRLTQGSR